MVPLIQPARIFLFDIDGVLVQPGGYRAATRSTLGHFLGQMDLPVSLAPDEAVMARFEANRITSEWDMAPISLAIILEEILRSIPSLIFSGSLAQALGEVKAALSEGTSYKLDLENLPYSQVINQIGSAIQSGETPSRTALRLSNHATSASLFPRLADSSILNELFANTRDCEQSMITRVFQHFTLGSAAFQLCYRRQAEFETPGLISMYDTSLISQAQIQTLLDAEAAGQLHMAVYTLRSSLPPREIPFSPPGYSPEAECALQIIQLIHIPLIGYGRLDYLAQMTGEDINLYLKPSPIQAIAAILAAVDGNELAAVIQARRFVLGKEFPAQLSANVEGGLEIHVFEDSRGGVEAVQSAVHLLVQAGIPAELFAWGISANPEKQHALAQVTDRLYTSTQEAVEAALKHLG